VAINALIIGWCIFHPVWFALYDGEIPGVS
jgi:hypothetical protein